MPTGYTAGIIDGEITTFQQFAKKCIRAFGAAIHMRDDQSDSEYTPRTPSKYHIDAINNLKSKIKELESISDEDMVYNEVKKLRERKEYHIDSIKKSNENSIILNQILDKVLLWTPPTIDHEGIKTFMIDQLKQTIQHDCNTEYSIKNISEIEKQLKGINATTLRKKIINEKKESLKYHTKQYKEDIKRCEESNKWVDDLINSL